jgi:hypothetical protein
MNKPFCIISVLFVCRLSCIRESNLQDTYQPPENIYDGFEVGSLVDVNINDQLIVEAIHEIYSGRFREVHSMLVFRKGRLVLEEYFQGHDYQWDGPDPNLNFFQIGRSFLEFSETLTKFLHKIHGINKTSSTRCL